jgi:1-deoxy-D-xylulose-5-phosphate reductoisomerase
MTETRRISVLGSTGSIGRSTLDVVQKSNGRFSVLGLAAGRNIGLLIEQIRAFRPEVVAVMTPELAEEVIAAPGIGPVQVLYGKEGYRAVASMDQADIVVSAMVGAAGLIPTLAALEAGKDVALANKESLVTAGSLVTSLAREKGAALIPIDSEHSAIFQCLEGHRRKDVKRVILTASGGPFRGRSRDELKDVTPEEAVRHPNWSMGAKISVDSSTMMNKGLEVVEAKWLFDLDWDCIDVVVHPQSIIHSMVEYVDGSIIAQMGVPDMRISIAYALARPERMDMGLAPLDLVRSGPLTFEAPDFAEFSCLALAYEAARTGGTATAALNAANEVAVDAFLDGRIGFLAIPEVIRSVLRDFPVEPVQGLDDVLKADALARLKADSQIYDLECRSTARSI